MKAGIMQPYFLPYIGYWQLLDAVDTFVVYDNIEFTRKGWINRNRYLRNGRDAFFTIPVKRDSDYLNIRERRISEGYDRSKLIRRIRNAYRSAPYHGETISVFEKIVDFRDENLFNYLFHSIRQICAYLGIDDSKIVVSSSIEMDHSLRSQEKVLALCRKLNAREYVNAIGGVALYDRERFARENIELKFIRTDDIVYHQFGGKFVPHLSILDVMMFNSRDMIRKHLGAFTLLEPGACPPPARTASPPSTRLTTEV